MAKMKFFPFFFLAIIFAIPSSAQNQALNKFVKSENLKHAGIGIKITDLETGNTVCKYNENLSLIPASALKLLTTASALEILGEKFVYTTKLYAVGKIDELGVLSGFLYIEGTGDPSLGSNYFDDDKEAFLKEWLSVLKNQGIKEITGGILVFDNPECYESVSSKWIMEDIGNYFTPEIYPLSVFDNTYSLYLKSGVAGTTPEIIRTDPEVGLIFKNYIKSASNNQDSTYIRGFSPSAERFLYGTIPSHREEFVIKGSIPNPPVFFAEYLKKYLNNNGIKIKGETLDIQYEVNQEDKLLNITYSKKLQDIIKVTNFRSNNHFAESLFYTIGKEKMKPDDCAYIPSLSSDYICKFWKEKGLDISGIFIYDGCGLSPSNAISASSLTDLLVYMDKQSKNSKIFRQSLPEAGKEGTVRNFLKTKNPGIIAHVKSGSISRVQSYSGYIEKNKKTYAFTIIINNFEGNRATLKTQIETFLSRF